MTEQEAQRMLNEARHLPIFVRGRYRFQAHRDGQISVFEAVGKSGQRWKWSHYTDAHNAMVPREMRERLGAFELAKSKEARTPDVRHQ